MNKIVTILILTICIGCSQKDRNKNSNQTKEIYTSNRTFGQIKNQILKTELDSIIKALPYGLLEEYKTTNLKEIDAVKVLKEELRTRGLRPNEFLIYEIKKHNDSVIAFHLDHIDGYVYYHNLKKLNLELSKNPTSDGMIEEIPPITGNISGHDGWYIININSKNLEIFLNQ